MQYALVAIVICGYVLAIWAAITYVYRDAPSRGMDGDQWAGVLALTAGVGFFLYLYRRGARQQRRPEDDQGPSNGA